jgi:hypothetical protein
MYLAFNFSSACSILRTIDLIPIVPSQFDASLSHWLVDPLNSLLVRARPRFLPRAPQGEPVPVNAIGRWSNSPRIGDARIEFTAAKPIDGASQEDRDVHGISKRMIWRVDCSLSQTSGLGLPNL